MENGRGSLGIHGAQMGDRCVIVNCQSRYSFYIYFILLFYNMFLLERVIE